MLYLLFLVRTGLYYGGRGLFGCGYFFGCAVFLSVPEMGRDSESVDAHTQCTRRKSIKLFPVGAVFINGFHGRRGNDTWADTAESLQLLRLAVEGVDSAELTVGITHENQEVAGGALLHLLERKRTVRI